MQIEKHSPAAYAFGPLFRTEASLQSGVSAFRFRRYVRVAFEPDRTGGREGTLAN
jgi:hypothetical protein